MTKALIAYCFFLLIGGQVLSTEIIDWLDVDKTTDITDLSEEKEQDEEEDTKNEEAKLFTTNASNRYNPYKHSLQRDFSNYDYAYEDVHLEISIPPPDFI